jgi:hypothetical protein
MILSFSQLLVHLLEVVYPIFLLEISLDAYTEFPTLNVYRACPF